MKKYLLMIITIILLFSCVKETNKNFNCFSDIATTRYILEKQATIQYLDNKFYIVENNIVDTKLLPCELAEEFKINNLLVTVSGEVKNTISTNVCCTENFVITKIK